MIVGWVIIFGVIGCKMICQVEEENEKLRKENEELKQEIEDLKEKIRELMQNFGKGKDEDES